MSNLLGYIKKQLGNEAIITDDGSKRIVVGSDSELLEGEVEATVYEVGSYLIRKSERFCRDRYLDSSCRYVPLSNEEVNELGLSVKKYKDNFFCRNRYNYDNEGQIFLIQEMCVCHRDNSLKNYSYVCSNYESLSHHTGRQLEEIYIAKANKHIPDNYASLFIHQIRWGKDSTVDYYYQIEPNGKIHSYSSGCGFEMYTAEQSGESNLAYIENGNQNKGKAEIVNDAITEIPTFENFLMEKKLEPWTQYGYKYVEELIKSKKPDKKELKRINKEKRKQERLSARKKKRNFKETKMEFELYQKNKDGTLEKCEQEQELSIEFLYGSDLIRKKGFKREEEFKKIDRIVKTAIFTKKNRLIPDIIFRESKEVPKDFYVVKIKGKTMFFGNIDKNFKPERMAIPGVISAVESVI